MPYIKDDRKSAINTGDLCKGPGELNYVLTRDILEYWNNSGQNYQALNDISGAMTEALAEFRRRVLVPYEKTKIRDNGDMY